ncbi:MAG: IS607 family transposase [Candidatus Thorarchaeota archaeon]
MKLSTWAKEIGITYNAAWKMYKAGKIPHKTWQLPTGTIIVEPQPKSQHQHAVIYARVSSHDQKCDLISQVARIRDYCAQQGLIITKEITEIGSGLNGKRKKLLQMLTDETISLIVVEYRDRITRFGFDYLEASLQAMNRKILVINETECQDDLIQDMRDVLTSFCTRLYGRRSAKKRAKKALEVCQA